MPSYLVQKLGKDRSKRLSMMRPPKLSTEKSSAWLLLFVKVRLHTIQSIKALQIKNIMKLSLHFYTIGVIKTKTKILLRVLVAHIHTSYFAAIGKIEHHCETIFDHWR